VLRRLPYQTPVLRRLPYREGEIRIVRVEV
jgi:hypothetical protein